MGRHGVWWCYSFFPNGDWRLWVWMLSSGLWGEVFGGVLGLASFGRGTADMQYRRLLYIQYLARPSSMIF